ncbi:MAG: hypothetical protein OXE96_07905 [Gemmatimonadetes bacterium]|nr:hypothetical protein [Gemmatimonadota bacterium]
MGGTWRADNCNPYRIDQVSSYKCAFKEGLADYGGNVGAPDDPRKNWETWDDGVGSPNGKIEGYVATLFHDLIDGGRETGDETDYDAPYVMKVFKTCEVKFTLFWKDRDDVSDFVWCLENRVNTSVHNSKFPGLSAPKQVKEGATEPDDWDDDDIRSTWILNVG